MASALTTFDAVLKQRYSKDLFKVSVCRVCTGRGRPGAWPVLYADLDGHCAEHDDPEHLAMLVMES